MNVRWEEFHDKQKERLRERARLACSKRSYSGHGAKKSGQEKQRGGGVGNESHLNAWNRPLPILFAKQKCVKRTPFLSGKRRGLMTRLGGAYLVLWPRRWALICLWAWVGVASN